MPWLLVWKNLRAHVVRTLLTVGSLAVAVFLLCFLRSVVVGLNAGVEASAANRLIVQSAVSLFVELPLAYQAKIEQVEGVDQVCTLQWFGGYYKEPSNFFAQFGIDHDRLAETYPEIDLVEGSWAALAERKTGCVIGRGLSQRFGWKIGDRVPLVGTIFPRSGGGSWEFEVVGIYRSTAANVDDQTLWFRFDYLRESIEQGAAGGPEGAGVYTLKIATGADPVEVARRIDLLFENGPQRVQTTTEAEFQRQFVSMLGNIPTFLSSIGGGVLFAVILAALNTMLMSARQRTRDLGVLKALGFTDGVAGALLLAEAVVLCAIGSALGAAFAFLSALGFRQGLQQILPTYTVTLETAGLGVAVGVGIGVLAGIVPAVMASRLRVVEAVRAEV